MLKSSVSTTKLFARTGRASRFFSMKSDRVIESAKGRAKFFYRGARRLQRGDCVFVFNDIPASAIAARTIVRMIASSANEAAGRSETGTQSLLPNWLLNL